MHAPGSPGDPRAVGGDAGPAAAAAAFLAHLASALVPGCDGAAVRAVVTTALTGAGDGPGRDGRRSSVLTRWGAPFEASVTGGRSGPDAALRYVADPASSAGFFGPRLAAQRAVLHDLVAAVGRDGSGGEEVDAFVDAVFPDPPRVPARTRAATFAGLVHDAGPVPAWVKAYGNLGGDAAALARLGERWPALAEVAAATASLPLVPRLAALGLAASEARRHKVYLRPREDDPAALPATLAHFGVRVGDLLPETVRREAVPSLGRRSYVAVEPGTRAAPLVTLYVPVPLLDAGRPVELVRGWFGDTAVLDLIAAAAASSGRAWDLTAVGLGGPAGGPPTRLTVYAAPRPHA